jgi:hypothetical protein
MHSSTRRVLSSLARRLPGLLAVFLFLTVSRPSLAQLIENKLEAEPAPGDHPPSTTEATPPVTYTPLPYTPLPSAAPPYAPPPGALPPAAPIVAAKAAAPAAEAPPPFTYGATLTTATVSETNSTSVFLSPLFEGAYAIHPSVVLDLTWGFGWLVDNQGIGESVARVGNPMLACRYRHSVEKWRLSAGLGVTAPLAHFDLDPNGRLYESLYNQTLAMWGMWNQWLWTPDRMAVPVTFRASYPFTSGPSLSADVALAPIFGVRGNASGTDVLGQFALEAQIPLGSVFVLGPRLQTVLLPSASIDRFQSAAGLRGTIRTKAGRFFAGLLVNLDAPLGSFGGLHRWGLYLGKEIDL